MATTALDQFVKEAIAAGRTRAEIKSVLAAAGWPNDQIDEALGAYAEVDFPVPVPAPRRYGSAREAFLYIVYFALLGVVAGYVGVLAFALVEFLFADDLSRQATDAGVSGLRRAIASLVVGYPIFIFLGARLAAAQRRDSKRRESRIRAWLTYITLIFASIILIGDLIAVVYQFLSGELGARFISKALVVGVISGAILWNFSRDVERTDARPDIAGRVLAIVTSAIAAGLVLWAATVVRSPGAARESLADERRVEDIGAIVRLVDCHRTYFGAPPASLGALEPRLRERVEAGPVAPGCAAVLPNDPESGTPYQYARLDGHRYRLCVTFEQGWPEDARQRDPSSRRRALRRWFSSSREERHILLPSAPGEACFEFTAIDILEDDDAEEQ